MTRRALLVLSTLWLAGCALQPRPASVVEAEPVMEAPGAASDLSRITDPDCVTPDPEEGDGIGGTGCRLE